MFGLEYRRAVSSEILSLLEDFDDNWQFDSNVVQIYSVASFMIKRMPALEIKKNVLAVSTEYVSLNVLANSIVHVAQNGGLSPLILTSYSRLYYYINDKKYEKKYIDEQQYENNKLVLAKAAIGNPFIK